MQEISIKVPNIACQQCMRAINRQLSSIEGLKSLDVDIPSKSIHLKFEEPASLDSITEALVQMGYPPERKD